MRDRVVTDVAAVYFATRAIRAVTVSLQPIIRGCIPTVRLRVAAARYAEKGGSVSLAITKSLHRPI